MARYGRAFPDLVGMPPVVYLLYRDKGWYVGQTECPSIRIREHKGYELMSMWVEKKRSVRLYHEKQFIMFCEAIGLPLRNKQHTNDWRGK